MTVIQVAWRYHNQTVEEREPVVEKNMDFRVVHVKNEIALRN